MSLAKFGPVRFDSGLATIGGVLGTIDHWRHDIVTMYVGDSSVKRAAVSGLRDGEDFTVAWRHR